jgi:hypothetical protein
MTDSVLTSIIDNNGSAYMENKNEVIFYSGENLKDEMLRVTKDGFYVRGIKVPQDEREAESVYKTFHQWLTWATLNRTF